MASGLKIAKAIVAGGMTAIPIAVQQAPLVQGVRYKDIQLLDEQDANEDEDVPLIDEPKGEKWDYATTTSRKDKPRKTGKFIEFLKKLFKLFSYVVFGGMVFAGATISKVR
ncbi:uncharacterized protein LOC143469519 [Clavelina lepadiformis]|uniref:uncharacterized protein LOC143469519 n=1 Tax=Clavelina lepadiformis TaxID=159417 RepID=UPI004041BE7E